MMACPLFYTLDPSRICTWNHIAIPYLLHIFRHAIDFVCDAFWHGSQPNLEDFI